MSGERKIAALAPFLSADERARAAAGAAEDKAAAERLRDWLKAQDEG
jgi:hypothetical protein